MADAGRRAMELDRDFKLYLSRRDFELLADHILENPGCWHALKQGGAAAVLAIVKSRRAA